MNDDDLLLANNLKEFREVDTPDYCKPYPSNHSLVCG